MNGPFRAAPVCGAGAAQCPPATPAVSSKQRIAIAGSISYLSRACRLTLVPRYSHQDRLPDDPAAIGAATPPRQPKRPRHGCHKGNSMSNPWLKKNPFMSMWLSGANSVVNSARGRIAAEAKRQSTTAVNKAASDMIGIWTETMTKPTAPKRRRKR